MLEILKNIISTYAGEIITGIIVTIVTVILTHILYKPKLRKEQKVRFQEVIGENIAQSLLRMREICTQASGIEKYNIEEELEAGNIVKAFELGIYPEIMNDGESFADFTSKIFHARKNDEHNLSRDAAAHLYYIQNYLIELKSYINHLEMQDYLPEMGCLFIYDIQRWEHSFDRIITKDINKHSAKISLHRGFLWERAKRKVHKKLYDKSLLVILQKADDELKPKKRVAKAEALNFIQFLKNSEEEPN